MKTKAAISLALGLTAAVSAALTYRVFRRDMERAEKRSSSHSQVVNTTSGPIEYASVGEGFPVLIVHGAGGGFDQLLGFASDGHLSEQGFRLVFVSRFGYLRTPLPAADASVIAQADAHAALLDALGIEKAAVIAVSAGAPSGLQLCSRHPEKCAGLALLVPATFVPDQEATAQNAPALTEFLRNTILKSDFAFWLATKIAKPTMIENILGTPLEVANRASAAERERLEKVLRNILPVSKRRVGLLNDAAVVTHLRPAEVARIKIPTLLISAEDDLYGTFRGARYLAEQIPGAHLVLYPDGGHLWIGHDEEFRKELEEFLRPFSETQAIVAWHGGQARR